MQAIRLFLIFTFVAVLTGMNFAFATTAPPTGAVVNSTKPGVADEKEAAGKNPFSFNLTIGFPSSITDKNSTTPSPANRDSNMYSAEENFSKARIYEYGANAELGEIPARHHTNAALKQAMNLDVDLVYIHLNAFADFDGAATDIRNKLTEFNKPMTVFIDNGNRGSGTIISLRKDSADKTDHPNQVQTSVYNLTGNQFQEKYKTYVNSIVNQAAKEKSKKTSSSNPVIQDKKTASVVQPEPGISVLPSSLASSNIVLYNYKPSLFEKILDFLLQPFMSFLLVFIISLGLLMEFRKPGSGFPLFASVAASLLFFIPLHLDGLADMSEIFLFLSGIALVLSRWIWPNKSFFLVPAGISIAGAGLVFCLCPSFLIPPVNSGAWRLLLKPLAIVASSFFTTWLVYRVLSKNAFLHAADDSSNAENKPVLQT